jgi:nucleotide-binding universal stress UspA family protein
MQSDLTVISKIALAFDGSKCAFVACDVAGRIADGFRAELTEIYVLPPSVAIRPTPVPDEKVRASLAKAMSIAAAYEGARTRTEILDPGSLSVYEALLDYSSRHKIDLLISGTRGLSGFERLLVGSVSSNLVSYASCSVLVVREPKNHVELKQIPLGRILVPIDGSEYSDRAVKLATSLGKAIPVKLTFTNVVYLPVLYGAGAGAWYKNAMDRYRDDAKKIVEEAKTFAAKYGVEADAKVIDDLESPVLGITRFADEENFDMIVIGTRGLGGFRKLLLGSVATGVLHYAHCSVLVVR